MKLLRNICTFSAAIMLLAGCSDDSLTQKQIEEGNTVISLDEEVSMPPIGSDFTLAFTSNSQWTIEGKPDWLTANKTSGHKGTSLITFAAGVNETRKDRTAYMKFVAKDGSFSKDFVVKQTFPYLSIDTDSLSFNWNNGRTEREGVSMDTNTAKVKVTSNVEWKIEQVSTKAASIDLTNFAISTLEGEDDEEVEFIPLKDNFGKNPFDIQVRIYPVMPDGKGGKVELSSKAVDSYIIKLHQKNLRFLINDSTDEASIEFSELNDKKDINFTIDAEIPWKVASCPEWVVMDKKSGKDIVSVNFLADGANPAKTVRSGSIRLTTDAGAYRDIEVSQRAYVFDIDNTAFAMQNDDTSAKTIHLNTTGTWEVADVPSWLTVSPSNGSGSADISVAAKGQNLTFSDYTQVIKVKSTMNTLHESVNVSQAKFVFEVTPATQLADLPTMNTSKYGVSISSSGRWDVTGIPDWLSVDVTDAGKGAFNIKVGANSGNPDLSSDRSATLTVTSLNHKDAGQNVTRTFTVKQRKYTFEISESNFGKLAAYSPASKKATVKCSANWEISSCPSWITPDITSGDGLTDVTISFIINDNLVKSARDENIVIKSLYNNETKSIRATQDAFVFDNASKSFDVPVMNSNGYTVSFNLTEGAPWKISSGYDGWLKPSISSGFGSATVIFTPDPNPNLAERTGSAVIYSTANAEGKTISFTQEKYVFDSTEENHSFTELQTASTPLNVVCSGPWTITDAPSWVTISKTSASTGEQISFNPSKNTALTDRSASFTVVSTLNGLTKKVKVHQDAFEFDSTPETYSYTTLEERADGISVLCSGKWEATDVPSWMTISSASGNGSQTGTTDNITVKSSKNLTESDRSAVIKITSKDNSAYTKKINVSQAKFDFRVDANAITYTDPLDVTLNTVHVTCPAAWTTSSNETWLHTSSGSGSSNGSFNIQPERNLTLQDRAATLTVTSTLNNLKRTVIVSQPKFIFEVGKSSLTSDSPLSGLCGTVSVRCSDQWNVSSESDWISLAKVSDKFDVALATNPNTEPRTGKVTVTSTLSGHTATVTVTQAAYVFDSRAEEVTLEACPATSATKSIICSGNWSASSSQTWLKVTPSSGKGNGSISIKADDNPSETDRTATVTVTSADNSSLKKVITVTQKGHTLTLDQTSVNLDAYTSADRSKTITVTTSGPWTATSNSTWLKVSQSVSNGNGSITLTADMNSSAAERNATVTVKCGNTTLSKTISVKQGGYVFDSSSLSLNFKATGNSSKTASVTCSGRWTASASDSWITATTSGTGNGNVSISVSDNTGLSPRSGSVTITSSENSSFRRVVSISQEAYAFSLSETSHTISDPDDVTPLSVNVTCSGTWSASTTANWLTVATTSTKMTVTPTKNSGASERTAEVTLTSAGHTLTYTVIQAAKNN